MKKLDFVGKLLWFSGPPGMGKSTTAQILARDHGYVYYEADAFNLLRNPFNSLDYENPSMGTAMQKILKGPGAAERSAIGKIFQLIPKYIVLFFYLIQTRLNLILHCSKESASSLGQFVCWNGV